MHACGTDNSKYISFAADGTVSLEFGNMSEENKAELLKSDKGLALINDLITTKDADGNDLTWQYEAGKELSIENLGYNKSVEGGVFSLSKNEKSINGGLSTDKDEFNLPKKGADGLVYIGPATFYGYDKDRKVTSYKVPRSSMVYHELRENWFRTSQACHIENLLLRQNFNTILQMVFINARTVLIIEA